MARKGVIPMPPAMNTCRCASAASGKWFRGSETGSTSPTPTPTVSWSARDPPRPAATAPTETDADPDAEPAPPPAAAAAATSTACRRLISSSVVASISFASTETPPSGVRIALTVPLPEGWTDAKE